MSFEQRELFIANLTRASNATIYVLPKVDIPAIQTSATNLGFHTRIFMNEDADEDPNGFLIIGPMEKPVIKLFEQVAEKAANVEISSPVCVSAVTEQGGNATLRAAAGGAVLGAVGTWAGLAFS